MFHLQCHHFAEILTGIFTTFYILKIAFIWDVQASLGKVYSYWRSRSEGLHVTKLVDKIFGPFHSNILVFHIRYHLL